jgi:hypothetical protein
MDIWQEMGGAAWAAPLQIELQATQALLREKLKGAPLESEVKETQDDIRTLHIHVEDPIKINALISSLAKKEKEIDLFFKEEETWEKEGKSQILFTSEWSKPLNDIPFLLPAAAVFKMYIFPFFAVLIPLISWLLPWIVIRIFFNMDMPFSTYKTMIMDLWLGGMKWEQMDMWKQVRVIFQSVWTGFGLYQSIHQPIQQAIHVQSLHATIYTRGKLLQEFVVESKELLSEFGNRLGRKIDNPYLDAIPVFEPIQTYAYIRDHPNDLKWILRTLSEQELKWRLASCKDLCLPTFSKNLCLDLEEFFDPSIPSHLRVKSNLHLKTKNHCLLTGPNQGGKSSSLRAILLNVWLAQRLGVAFAASMKLSPFLWCQSGLRLADKPGERSLFEREIMFAKQTLTLSKEKGYGLVLYDECFHSTNPPDGEKTAQIFLSHLWKSPTTISIVSSHVFSLVESAPNTVEKLCVPAEQTPQGIQYTFTLTPGICKVSSVEEIYKKYRFPLAAVKE